MSAMALVSMVQLAARELHRPDFTLEWAIQHAVQQQFIRPSDDDRNDAEIERLQQWIHALVVIDRAGIPELFGLISERLAWARPLVDSLSLRTPAQQDEALRTALMHLELLSRARLQLEMRLRETLSEIRS